MQTTRNNLDTNPGPGDWFTGSVFVDTVAAPSEGSQAPSLEDGDRRCAVR